MSISRRQFLTGAALAAGASAVGLSACGGGSGSGSSGGTSTLQFTWWGNPLRNKMTDQAIKAYTKANSGVTIKPQPGEWSSYWDKLATQTAGNTAPDIIQMDMAYISEYASRGALLDLSKYGVDTSNWTQGTADSGKIDGQLVGANAGVNSLAILANPAVFEKAGVELPDDKTWTWDDYKQIAAEITAKGGSGVTGSSSAFGSDNLLQIWLRQNGKDTFSSDGLGFTADDLVPYLTMMVDFEKAKAIPTPSAINEEASKTLDQTSLAQGKQGMALYWSNQLAAVNDAAGTTMRMLRPPTVAGDATKRNAWYKASMLWSASSRTKNPEAAGKLINWWVNNKAAADICLDERGIPANPDMVAEITPKLSKDGKTAAQYIADIKPELGTSPVAPPPGGGTLGDVLNRHATDLLFGRANARDAATKIVDELKSNLQS